MTPYKTEGVVLTRNGDTLDLRSRAIECSDFGHLARAAPKRGSNRPIPQVRGSAVRRRTAGEVRTSLTIHIDGTWDEDGDAAANKRLQAHQHVDLVLDFLDDDDPCDITLHRPAGLDPLVGLLQVEDPGEPQWQTLHVVRFVVDVTLPQGRLLAEESS